jgi:chromate reductase
MADYRIALVVGSLRKDSINRRLANAVTRLAPPDFQFVPLDIGAIPLYNQDNDGALAASVVAMKAQITAAQALLFVTPEYNRSIPGVLKNALDTGSRPYGQNAWAGKPAGILSASVGAIGGALAQQHLRNVLVFLDVPALTTPEVFLQIKDGFFDAEGNIASGDTRTFLQAWMNRYVTWVRKHVG